jgi:hypothetical protein
MKMPSEDKKADIHEVEGRGEPVSRMEPILMGESSRKRGEVIELAASPPDSAAACRSAWSLRWPISCAGPVS